MKDEYRRRGMRRDGLRTPTEKERETKKGLMRDE